MTEPGGDGLRAKTDDGDGPGLGSGRRPDSVVVIGTGLIGTSIALALREQDVSVWLADADDQAVILAANLGAGQPLPADGVPGGPADIVVLAVPPAAVASELRSAQARGLARTYTDVASVKELPAGGCPRAWLRPGQLPARPPAVWPRAVGPGGGQSGPVRRPAVGLVPAARDRRNNHQAGNGLGRGLWRIAGRGVVG